MSFGNWERILDEFPVRVEFPLWEQLVVWASPHTALLHSPRSDTVPSTKWDDVTMDEWSRHARKFLPVCAGSTFPVPQQH